uniref:Cyoups1 protein n=1 Tax=Pseudomonas putida TaxID=303 RepID=Q9WWQ9_PSEPU|nr:cyoups1 [Pseudomonas putida]
MIQINPKALQNAALGPIKRGATNCREVEFLSSIVADSVKDCCSISHSQGLATYLQSPPISVRHCLQVAGLKEAPALLFADFVKFRPTAIPGGPPSAFSRTKWTWSEVQACCLRNHKHR